MEFKAEIIAYHCQTLLSSEHCLKSGAVISVLNSARSAPSKLLKHMTECSPICGTACSYLFTLATERTRKSVEKHDGIGANSSWKLATCQRTNIGFVLYFWWLFVIFECPGATLRHPLSEEEKQHQKINFASPILRVNFDLFRIFCDSKFHVFFACPRGQRFHRSGTNFDGFGGHFGSRFSTCWAHFQQMLRKWKKQPLSSETLVFEKAGFPF